MGIFKRHRTDNPQLKATKDLAKAYNATTKATKALTKAERGLRGEDKALFESYKEGTASPIAINKIRQSKSLRNAAKAFRKYNKAEQALQTAQAAKDAPDPAYANIDDVAKAKSGKESSQKEFYNTLPTGEEPIYHTSAPPSLANTMGRRGGEAAAAAILAASGSATPVYASISQFLTESKALERDLQDPTTLEDALFALTHVTMANWEVVKDGSGKVTGLKTDDQTFTKTQRQGQAEVSGRRLFRKFFPDVQLNTSADGQTIEISAEHIPAIAAAKDERLMISDTGRKRQGKLSPEHPAYKDAVPPPEPGYMKTRATTTRTSATSGTTQISRGNSYDDLNEVAQEAAEVQPGAAKRSELTREGSTYNNLPIADTPDKQRGARAKLERKNSEYDGLPIPPSGSRSPESHTGRGTPRGR